VYEPPKSPFRVPFDGSWKIAKASTEPPDDAPKKKQRDDLLEEQVELLDDLQRRLYAQDTHSLLLVFQAMDAAGKDGTIRAVMQGIDPAGCQVYSFKRPSDEELDHDFLWRTAVRLPERGRIGIFNRSYYEEVLVVRVNPGILESQKIPRPIDSARIFQRRFKSIRDHEEHLAENGTVIVKFFLHVSKDEQRARFLERIEQGEKNWKFESGDIRERGKWDAYQQAYEEALNETSRPWAPWYAVPADSKSYLRLAVAETVVKTLDGLDLKYPTLPAAEIAALADAKKSLLAEDKPKRT